MPSSRFKDFLDEIERIRLALLPEFSRTGEYSASERKRTSAYRILVHAEIESLIEDRCMEIAKNAIIAYEATESPTIVGLHLLAFQATQKASTPESIAPQGTISGKDWHERFLALTRLKTALSDYLQIIDANNGIKEKHLLRMLIPIGIKTNQLDSSWLATIEGFAVNRGSTAHKSASALQTLLDPKTESDTVTVIVDGLKKLDTFLEKLAES
jgi:hypothetical protein